MLLLGPLGREIKEKEKKSEQFNKNKAAFAGVTRHGDLEETVC